MNSNHERYEPQSGRSGITAGHSSRTRIITAAIALLLALLGLVLGHARSRTIEASTADRPMPAAKLRLAEPAPAARLTPAAPSQNIQVELITIQPYGFEPKQISRPAGQFLLAVDNRSGIGDVAVHLDKDTGLPVFQQPLNRRKRDWGQVFNLTAGDYIVSEPSHPDWQCRIKIRPN